VLKRLVVIIMLVLSSPLRLGATQVKKEGWKFPNIARATKKAIHPIDTTDRIPDKETLVKTYQKEDGVVFSTLEIEGEVFACQFRIMGAEGAPPTTYAIVDTDGDSSFETKYLAGETPKTPEWVILRYYKKHPELKDPARSLSVGR